MMIVSYCKKSYKILLASTLAVVLCCFALLPQRAVQASTLGIKVPIIMYHSILKDPDRAGKFIISPDLFEQDLIYLRDNDYTTVFVKDLVDYVYNGIPLPEKPVVITLDDGYYNNLTYILPILQKYDMKAVISVVGTFADTFTKQNDHNPNYSHLTWEDIGILGNSGYVEIGNHTYNLHTNTNRKGSAIKQGEDIASYQKMLSTDLQKLQDGIVQNSGIVAPITYAYPYGYISDASLPVIKELGFKASLSCFEKLNYLTHDPEGLYSLGRFNRPAGISTKNFMKKILTEK